MNAEPNHTPSKNNPVDFDKSLETIVYAIIESNNLEQVLTACQKYEIESLYYYHTNEYEKMIDSCVEAICLDIDSTQLASLFSYNLPANCPPEINPEVAIAKLKKAENHSDTAKLYLAGAMIFDSEISLEDKEKTIKNSIFPLAEKGHANAISCLSNAYLNGIVVEKNIKYGFELMQKAANLETARATYNLATLHIMEACEGTSLDTGMNLLYQSAESNCQSAIYKLAEFHAEGQYVEKNEEISFRLSKKAYDLGHYQAFSGLMFFYFNSEQRNIEAGLEIIEKLSSLKSDHAAAVLLKCFEYIKEYGTKDDHQKAFQLANNIVNLGDINATAVLADFYKEGLGIEKSYTRAMELMLRVEELAELEKGERPKINWGRD